MTVPAAPLVDQELLPAAADPGDRHTDRSYHLAVLALACVSFVASYVIYRTLVPLGTGDLDEGVYVFQAHMFLHGLVSLPVDKYGEFFRPWLSGQRDGRIFTVYQPGMPAFIAFSLRVFGSAKIGIALLAALEIPAAYGFTKELLGNRRVALTTCVFLAFTPMFLLHSALVLSYVLSLLGLTSGGWALLRATRTHRTRDVVLGGLLLGITILTRPFDAVLFGVPLLVFVAYRMRHDGILRRLVGPIAVGLAPAIAITLWYNWLATGGILDFPNNTAAPLNTFGFGTRNIMVGQPTFNYNTSLAYRALTANLHGVPTWLFGGIVTVALALFGVFVLRKHLAEDIVLVVLACAFPAGYFFWWATALSSSGATNGLGPHYYIPSFLPVLVLGAVGFTRLTEGRGWLITALGAAVLVAVTGWAIPDKINANYGVTKSFERVHNAIPHGLTNALVFVHTGAPYLLASYPFLQTDPDLQGPVIYVGDHGIQDADLIRQMSSRRAYVLTTQYEPGDDLFAPTGGLTPVEAVSGTRLTIAFHPLQPAPLGAAFARVYLTVDGETHYVPVTAGPKGVYPSVTWTVSEAQPASGAAHAVVVSPGPQGQLTVGIETSSTSSFAAPTRTETRMPYQASSGMLESLPPGLGWVLAQFPHGKSAWLPSDVSGKIDVRVSGT